MINVDVLVEPSTQHRLKIGFRLCLENRHIQPNLPDDDQEVMRDLTLKEEIVKAGIKLFKVRSELEKDSPQIDHIRKLYPGIDDQAARDIRLIAQAVHWAFGKNDLLAVAFVRHFLDRNEKRRGRTVKIRMADLLSQDIGARSRIFQAISGIQDDRHACTVSPVDSTALGAIQPRDCCTDGPPAGDHCGATRYPS
jgi:hypothetical protein